MLSTPCSSLGSAATQCPSLLALLLLPFPPTLWFLPFSFSLPVFSSSYVFPFLQPSVTSISSLFSLRFPLPPHPPPSLFFSPDYIPFFTSPNHHGWWFGFTVYAFSFQLFSLWAFCVWDSSELDLSCPWVYLRYGFYTLLLSKYLSSPWNYNHLLLLLVSLGVSS